MAGVSVEVKPEIINWRFCGLFNLIVQQILLLSCLINGGQAKKAYFQSS